jgi:hypothetical protein
MITWTLLGVLQITHTPFLLLSPASLYNRNSKFTTTLAAVCISQEGVRKGWLVWKRTEIKFVCSRPKCEARAAAAAAARRAPRSSTQSYSQSENTPLGARSPCPKYTRKREGGRKPSAEFLHMQADWYLEISSGLLRCTPATDSPSAAD